MRIPYIIICLLLTLHLAAYAQVEAPKYEDVTVSVVVNSNFKISGDDAPVDFGPIDGTKIIELYPDRYFNEIICVSNNGRQWYLKADCDNLVGSRSTYPKDRLKIKVFWTDGKGSFTSDWIAFGERPILIYSSGSTDNTGTDVRIQLVYKLEPAPDIVAGNYNAHITYLMTEAPQ